MFFTIQRFLVLFVALALLGLGCNKAQPTQTAQTPADSGTQPAESRADAGAAKGEIPEGWLLYQGNMFTVRHPKEWNAQADVLKDPQPADLERVWFGSETIPQGAETEVVLPVMLEVGSGNLADRIGRYEPLLTRSTIEVDQREIIHFTYEDDFMGGTPVVYAFEEDGRVYLLLRTDGDETNLETMIRTVEAR